MNSMYTIGTVVVIAGAMIAVLGTAVMLWMTQRHPYQSEKAPIKSSPAHGVFWSFTTGMLPWKKESARIHWVAYIRGAIFHICIFLGAVLLLISPWLADIPLWLHSTIALVMAVGAILGLGGFWIRWRDPVMRLLSTPDDYASLGLATLFLTAAAAAVQAVQLVPVFWIISGVILAYIPFGKLRHFIYFFYSRAFLGLVFGRRGVLE
jgi:hypothetical protein